MKTLFNIASLLTYPICNAREYYWMGRALNKPANLKTGTFLITGAILAPLGMIIRSLASKFLRNPYLYEKGFGMQKSIDKSLSLLSWNVCFVPAGYSITDGGVFPWRDRIEGVVEKIKKVDANVVCLMEVFDYDAATDLLKKLKTEYAYFYFNIGPKGVGVSSGFFIASKMKISNPEFIRFQKEHLIGRTKNAAKGLFMFTVENKVKIMVTHLQHSEECEHPTVQEVEARMHQMNLVMKYTNSENIPVIITGDLNLDETECNHSSWAKNVDRGLVPLEKTWRGDEFAARLMKKKISGPLTYDYTMSVKGSDLLIQTSYVETEYDPRVFKKGALSDHLGLLSVITFK